MFVHLVALNVLNWLSSALIRLHYSSKFMVTVQQLVLHLVNICSLVLKIKSRFLAGRSQFLAGRSRFLAGRSRFLAG